MNKKTDKKKYDDRYARSSQLPVEILMRIHPRQHDGIEEFAQGIIIPKIRRITWNIKVHLF